MKFANSLYVVAITATGMANRIGIGIVKSLTASHWTASHWVEAGVETGVEVNININIGDGVGIADSNGRFVRSAGADMDAGVSIYGG